ncbi:fasciclin domain-containing protein [Nocardioides ochotonae]|uniref:fasciclin domain-containing protein n=1 Tax=Nocardioides ochotonae TaxID=2685869 RepID=UPI00140C00A6|nr:fasciclin domain-containing protein [Nocardioides ochotonae]
MKRTVSTTLKLALSGVVTAALASTAVMPAAHADTATERKAGNKSLAKVLAADGTKFDKNWKDFDILEKGVLAVLDAKPHSPVALLTQGGKRATAFLPTDAAFRALVKDIAGSAPKTERATFNALASVADVDTLEAVLLYHVVAGKTLTSKKVLASDGAKVTTALGGTIKIDVRGKGKKTKVFLVDLDKGDANPQVVQLDINKGNKQIGHGINRVLRPIDLP